MWGEAADRASVAGSVLRRSHLMLTHWGSGLLSVWLWELWWFEGPEGLQGLELRAGDCRSNCGNSSGATEEKVVMLSPPHSADSSLLVELLFFEVFQASKHRLLLVFSGVWYTARGCLVLTWLSWFILLSPRSLRLLVLYLQGFWTCPVLTLLVLLENQSSVRQGKVVDQLPRHLGCGITAPTPPELSTATEVLQTWSST